MLGLLILASLLSCIAALLVAWRLRQQRNSARAEIAVRHDREATRERILGLLAPELQALGLALRGHVAALPPSVADGPAADGVEAAAARLLALSDELSELLATEGRLRVLHPAPLPLLPVLEAAVAAASAQLGPARRDWRVAPEFAAITLSADARAMRGALDQVLTRAARMTRDGDWIGLRPMVTPDGLAIIVEDEGAGLPAEDAAPEAATAAPEAAARTRGLGFGLAVARALLEAHGGSLRIEALQGVGARTWLTLPRERLIAA